MTTDYGKPSVEAIEHRIAQIRWAIMQLEYEASALVKELERATGIEVQE
jgi:hypothetical protein